MTGGTETSGAGATTGARVVRGGLWKMLANALPQLYTLVLSIAAARYLGSSGMGRQSFIAFVEASTITLLSASFSLALMRYVGEAVGAGRPGAARWLVGSIARIVLVAAVVGGATLVLVGVFGGPPAAAWYLAAVATFNGIVVSIPSAMLTGLQRWRQATIAGLGTGGLGVVATLAVLALGGGITGMFAVEAVTTTVAVVWTATLARGAMSELQAAPTRALELRRGALRFAAFSFGGTLLYLIVWRRSEFFFLNHYSSDNEIAYYSIAFAIATGVVRLPSAMGEVLAPAIATLFGAGAHDRIRTGFGRALRLLLLATLPVTAAAAAVGPEAIRVIWGQEFSPADKPFLVMVAASLLTPLTILSSALLAGIGRVGVPLAADAAAAAVDVGVAFALVPDHGALGAAIASACGLLVAGAPQLVYAARLTGPIHWGLGGLVRGVLIAAVGGAVAYGVVEALGGVAGVVLGLVGGTAVFLALSLLVGFLPREDAHWLQDVIGTRGGRLPGQAVLALAGRRQ